MRVLVTGGAGYIGKILLEKMKRFNYDLFSIDYKKCDDFQCESFNVDLLDFKMLRSAISAIKPNYVIHMAGVKDRKNDYNTFKKAININLIGSLNLMQVLQEVKTVKKIIVIGTAEEYGRSEELIEEEHKLNPINAYSFSKQCLFNLCDYYIREENLPIFYLRPSLIYGPNQDLAMFLPSLIDTLRSDHEYKMTRGEQKRDFLHVDDLLDLIVTLINTKQQSNHGVYNVCSGERVRIVDIARYVGEKMEKLKFIKIGALPYRPGEIMEYRISNRKLMETFDWKPKVRLFEGIDQILSSELKVSENE